MTLRASITLPLIVLLAACGGSDAQREEGGAGEAEGEVLGGSISDEMLPLDAVKSQSPPLKASPSAAGDEEVTEESEEIVGDDAGADAPAEPAAPAN